MASRMHFWLGMNGFYLSTESYIDTWHKIDRGVVHTACFACSRDAFSIIFRMSEDGI